MKILSSLLNLYDFFLSQNTKDDILQKIGNRTALDPIHFYCTDTKQVQCK